MSGNSPDEDYSPPAEPNNNNNPNTEDVNNISSGNNNNNNNNPVSNNPLSDAIRTTTTGSNNNNFATPEGNNTPNYPPAVTNSRVAGGESDEMPQGGGLVIRSSTSSASGGWSKVFILLSILLNIISVGVGIYFFTTTGGGGGGSRGGGEGGGSGGGGGSTVGLGVYWDDTSGSGQGPDIGGGLVEDATGHGNVENFEGVGLGAPEGVKSLLGVQGEGGGGGTADVVVVGGISIDNVNGDVNGGGGTGAEEDLGGEGMSKWGNTITKGGHIVIGGGDGSGGGGGGGLADNLLDCSDNNDGSCKTDDPSKYTASSSSSTATEEEEDKKKKCQETPYSKRRIPTRSSDFRNHRDRSDFSLTEASVVAASKVVKGIIGKHSDSVVSVLQEEKCLRNPFSEYDSKNKHFLLTIQRGKEMVACEKVKDDQGIVYLFGNKIGYTRYPQKRCQYYESKYESFKPEQFEVLFRMRCISKSGLEKLYKILVDVINDIGMVKMGHVRFLNAVLEPPKGKEADDSEKEEYSSLTTSESSISSISSISDEEEEDDDVEVEIDLEKIAVDDVYRQWFRIAGVRSSLLLQLIEYCLQKQFKMEHKKESMAEGFGWPSQKYKELQLASKNMFHDIVEIIDDVIPSQEKVKVQLLSTWPPSMEPHKLYTFNVIMEAYGLKHLDQDLGWKDAIEHPVYDWHEGLTIDQIYSTDYSDADKDEADETFCRFVRDGGFKTSARPYSLLVLDAQNWLYGSLVEAQNTLKRFKYSRVKSLYGGEIIVWKNPTTVLLLVGHPSKAGDASGNVLFEDMQRRAATVNTVRNLVWYVNGEIEKSSYLDYTECWAASVMEHISKNLHQHNMRIFQALSFRDAILSVSEPHTSALSTFGGKGSSTQTGVNKAKNILAVSSYVYDDTESVLGSDVILEDEEDETPCYDDGDFQAGDNPSNDGNTRGSKVKKHQWFQMVREVVNAFSWSDDTTLPQDLSNLKQLIEEYVYSHRGKKNAFDECRQWRRILTTLSDYYQDSSLPSSVKSWAARDKKNLRFDIAVDGDCKYWDADLEPSRQQTVEMKQQIDKWIKETFFGKKPAQYGYLVARQLKHSAADKEKTFADFSEELAAFVKDKLGTIGIPIIGIPMRSTPARNYIENAYKDHLTITLFKKNNSNHPLGSNRLEDIVTYKISRKVKMKTLTMKTLENYFDG